MLSQTFKRSTAIRRNSFGYRVPRLLATCSSFPCKVCHYRLSQNRGSVHCLNLRVQSGRACAIRIYHPLRACAQRLDITDRWLSEEALVFAIELAGTFVSDLKGRPRRVEFVDKHLLSSGVQAQLLLELKRAHCCQSAKVVMQRRSAHSGHSCQFIHL